MLTDSSPLRTCSLNTDKVANNPLRPTLGPQQHNHMKNLSLLAAFVVVLGLVGCAEDKSSETRQVSTPNPPVKPMTNPNAPNGNNMPDQAKDVIGKVAPGAAGN